MSKDMNVRWAWLKIMYWYTIVGAGGFGLAMVLFPETVRSLFSPAAGQKNGRSNREKETTFL